MSLSPLHCVHNFWPHFFSSGAQDLFPDGSGGGEGEDAAPAGSRCCAARVFPARYYYYYKQHRRGRYYSCNSRKKKLAVAMYLPLSLSLAVLIVFDLGRAGPLLLLRSQAGTAHLSCLFSPSPPPSLVVVPGTGAYFPLCSFLFYIAPQQQRRETFISSLSSSVQCIPFSRSPPSSPRCSVPVARQPSAAAAAQFSSKGVSLAGGGGRAIDPNLRAWQGFNVVATLKM